MGVGKAGGGRFWASTGCHVLEEAAMRGVVITAQLLAFAKLGLDLLVDDEVDDRLRNAVVRSDDAAVEAADAVISPSLLHTAQHRQALIATAASTNVFI